MEILLSIIFIVFGVLQIILFFKVWGMTNDIRAMKNKYLYQDSISTNFDSKEDNGNYKKDTLVVELKTEKQMRTGELLDNGMYKCYSNGIYVGDFAPSDFMEFEQWVKQVYKRVIQ